MFQFYREKRHLRDGSETEREKKCGDFVGNHTDWIERERGRET